MTDQIRVRMYRVGFGDFFLLTVPGNDGPAHILIDCGVHATPVPGALDACIEDLKVATDRHLSLVIATHYHADHLSGFATNQEDFREFRVDAVWITNRLKDTKKHAVFLDQLTSVAHALQVQLAARGAEDDDEDDDGTAADPYAVYDKKCKKTNAKAKVQNALGLRVGAGEDDDDGSNRKALTFLQAGLGSPKAKVTYYEAGDPPKLPADLKGAITAEILAPVSLDQASNYRAEDDRAAQYLAAAGDAGRIPNGDALTPFVRDWPASAADYPDRSFDEFAEKGDPASGERGLRDAVAAVQGDALAAAAEKLDGTLNNQSLVVLFTCQGRNLLFVGDAQWGNWASWLYGEPVKGKPPALTDRAREILGSLDFYKVGHHGSTNATPIPVVEALNPKSAAMCSTAVGAYGCRKSGTEVPRLPLLDALQQRTGGRTVRSDWATGEADGEHVPYERTARIGMKHLPQGFTTTDELYVDFVIRL